MKITKAYKYMKRIIEDSKEKNSCTVASVRRGLRKYVKTLNDQGELSPDGLSILNGIIAKIESIMTGLVNADELFIDLLDENFELDEYYDEDEDEDEDEDNYSSSSDCGRSRSRSSC